MIRSTVKQEQDRQARAIHGGWLNAWIARLGVALSRVPIPTRPLRSRVYRTLYGRKYQALNESELDQPLEEYRSLNALFTRGIAAGCREWSTAADVVDSPCDCTVQDFGPLTNQHILTAKGISYSVPSLLAQSNARPFDDGSYTVLFLSPADCHRIYCPIDARLTSMTHVPGSRLLVHPPYQTSQFPVFTLNERVILRLESAIGAMVLVLIAGWGVGHITHPFPHTFTHGRDVVTRNHLDVPLPLSRGDWIATFELGSTVILLTERRFSSLPSLVHDSPIRMGTPLMTNPAPDDPPRRGRVT